MTDRRATLLFSIGALLLTTPARAEVEVPNIFSDQMVFQRDLPIRVWGRADAGEVVRVSIAGNSVTATADDAGDWSVEAPALPAGGPHELVVAGTNTITIGDVLVGEVWLCAGQSNMEWRVNNSIDGDLAKLTANDPGVRMINFPNVGVQEPVWTHPKARWMPAVGDNVGQFSAVGYHFGLQLRQALGVPIGLVNNAWGGSAADSWVSRDTLREWDDYAETLAAWRGAEARHAELAAMTTRSESEEEEFKALSKGMTGQRRPANSYNGVLKSHLGYGVRGAIWYQGESNAGRAYQYRDLFPLMVREWRREWGQGDFPFYWVQLADFLAESPTPEEHAWAELREAQTMAQAVLPNSGQAVIIDLGEGRDIHPRDKRSVGRRLARLALANDYGLGVASRSPELDLASFADGKATLTFKQVDGQLRAFDTKRPVGFAIAGGDRRFVWADAQITGPATIEVSSPEVPTPVAVRYAWAGNPVCNVYDSADLPLTPFRTDDWDGLTAGKKNPFGQ